MFIGVCKCVYVYDDYNTGTSCSLNFCTVIKSSYELISTWEILFPVTKHKTSVP